MAETPKNSRSQSTYSGKASKRLRKFELPDGRLVHIALSPEEAESLKLRLEAIKPGEPFDLVINGSPEHLEALRKAQSHNLQIRDTIRQKHAEVYDEFEKVRTELDKLNNELHMLTVDHSLALDANFSKFGYNATLRTYDDTTESSASSFYEHDESQHVARDWEEERRSSGRTFKMYKTPVVRQYFHQGLLWRASSSAEVATFELFLDLIFVGIIAVNGDSASEKPTGEELLRFSITFIMSYRIWSDITVVTAWFVTDDVMQRLSFLFTMACLVGFTTNMLGAFEDTWAQLVAFFLAARLFLAVYYGFISWVIPMVRGMMICQSLIVVLPGAIWIASIYVDMPTRLSLIWIAIAVDLFGSLIIVLFIRSAEHMSKSLSSIVSKHFAFYPAVNIEHKVERTNAFVTLIIGYSVVSLLYQNTASFGLNSFFGKAVLGLIQAFCLNTIYFEIDADSIWEHAIRRSVGTSMLWVSAHLPFLLGYSLYAASLSKLVLATDCGNSPVESLGEAYLGKSEEFVSDGIRWFYCGGLGVALLSMAIISISHIHRETNGIRLSKNIRLVNRLCVSVIIICLPLAKSLDSLQLVAIATCLIFWVLVLEAYGCSCPKEGFWGDKSKCAYSARCKLTKKDIERAAVQGNNLEVKSLANTGEKGMYEMS